MANSTSGDRIDEARRAVSTEGQRGQAVGSMPDDVLRPKCKNITFIRCQLGVFLLCIMERWITSGRRLTYA
ncbi:hypothetical protein EMCRGX_G026399 [Ephydatia muelleri]